MSLAHAVSMPFNGLSLLKPQYSDTTTYLKGLGPLLPLTMQYCTLHVARKGRKGPHFVVFRVAPSRSEQVIDVLRLLHDSMDLPRHPRDGVKSNIK